MIKIKCLLRNGLTQYKVNIYSNDCLVNTSITDMYGITYVNLKNGLYQIEIINNKYNINYHQYFYVTSYTSFVYFGIYDFYKRSITFYLQDRYYLMPIMKGEINLWLK